MLSLLGAAALGFIGCSRDAPPAPLPLAEAPATIESAFKDAPPEAKAFATELSSALRTNDSPRAFVELQSLQGRADLSAEQREVVARSLAAVSQELNAAAANGDPRAQQVLEIHRARK